MLVPSVSTQHEYLRSSCHATTLRLDQKSLRVPAAPTELRPCPEGPVVQGSRQTVVAFRGDGQTTKLHALN